MKRSACGEGRVASVGVSRRGFLMGAAASGCALVGSIDAAAEESASRDESFSVFLADPHVPGDNTVRNSRQVEHDPDYMYKRLVATVDEIMSMRPLPARVVVFGDLAYLRGERADYEKTKPLFDRLSGAKMDVVFGMGNHDHREAFFETYPEWRDRTLVAGEVVSKVSLGHADLLMLDTLTENTSAPGAENPGGGSLSSRQAEWLAQEAAKATRPFLVGAHHSVYEVKTPVNGKPLAAFLLRQPLFCGYIHGHNHVWKTDRMLDWGRYVVRRVAALPSVGFWGDLGHALFRTSPQLAQLRPVVREFCFPRHQPDPAKRPRTWAAIAADAKDATCRFPLESL